MRRVFFAGWLSLSLLISYSFAQEPETLSEVLRRDGLSVSALAISNARSAISSYSTLNDDQEFVIAYYLVDPSDRNRLRPPLMVARLQKNSGKWSQASIQGAQVDALGRRAELKSDCLGSVLQIQRHDDLYFLDLHLNPSAGCILILNHNLTLHRTLGGSTEAFFKSGPMVYLGNMVHFAPIHPEKVFLYDLKTDRSNQIYPQVDDPFRREFSARLSKVIDQTKCRENNWPCDPQEFESSIAAPIEVNDETHSLGFKIKFSPAGFVSREDAEKNDQWTGYQYVYIYQVTPMRWRAFSADDLKRKFGTNSVKELLTQDKLRQVFACSAQ